MFKIGDFSKLGQVSVRTLHHYERLGLLRPAWVDRFTGYRYYTPEQLPRLNRILALKDLGFSLEEIGRLLGDNLSAAELRGMLRLKQAELERTVQAEQARLARVAARLAQIESEGRAPEYEVVLKAVSAQWVMGLRQRIASYGEVGRLFDRLRSALQEQSIGLPSGSPCLALYYDAQYRAGQVDVEAAVPCERRQPIPGLLVHELPQVPAMACTVHQGGYSTLGEAYHTLAAWVQANGYRLQAPNREVYLTAPGEPGLTEIQFPVEKLPVPPSLGQKEKEAMEPKIVDKPAFSVIGLRYYGRNQKGEIPQLWGEFNARSREIEGICGPAYGLCDDAISPAGEFEYVAGLEVQGASPVPEGMVRRDVPAKRYAVFTHRGPLSELGKTYDYIWQVWLPNSGHRRAPGCDFELYDERFDADSPESVFEIYVPIE